MLVRELIRRERESHLAVRRQRTLNRCGKLADRVVIVGPARPGRVDPVAAVRLAHRLSSFGPAPVCRVATRSHSAGLVTVEGMPDTALADWLRQLDDDALAALLRA